MVNRAIGIATVKPSCPTRASDPQTEGGGFCFMRCSRPSYLLNSTYRIIAQGTNFMQRQHLREREMKASCFHLRNFLLCPLLLSRLLGAVVAGLYLHGTGDGQPYRAQA